VGVNDTRSFQHVIVIDQQRLAGGDDGFAVIAPDIPGGFSPRLSAASHAAYSRLWKTYFASERLAPSARRAAPVFQPQ